MSIRIPPRSDIDTQNAFRDVERQIDETNRILARLRQDAPTAQTEESQNRLPDDRKVFVPAGPMHAVGLVPDPGATAGGARFLQDNGTWAIPSRLSPYAFNMRDDFVSGSDATSTTIGQLGWTVATTGNGGTANIAGIPNHPGVQYLTTGTTNNGLTAIFHHAAYYNITLADIDRICWIVAGSSNGGAFRPVATTAVTSDLPAGTIGFEVKTGDTNWYSISVDGSGTTRKDTGVAFSNDGWVVLEMVRNGSTWDFYVNAVQKTNHSGAGNNVPADTTDVQVIVQVKSDTTSRTLYIDLIDVYGEVSRA